MCSCERERTASMTTSSLFIITRAFRMRLIYDLNGKRAHNQQTQPSKQKQVQFAVYVVMTRIPILPAGKISTKIRNDFMRIEISDNYTRTAAIWIFFFDGNKSFWLDLTRKRIRGTCCVLLLTHLLSNIYIFPSFKMEEINFLNSAKLLSSHKILNEWTNIQYLGGI